MPEVFKINRPKAIMTVFHSGDVDYRHIAEDGSLSASQPFYEKTIRDLMKDVKVDKDKSKKKHLRNFIPEKLLYLNTEYDVYIWKCPASVRKLYHTNKIHEGDYALPNLVFKLNKNMLKVVAVKSFTPESKMYTPPFPNVGGSGGVCMGSAEIRYQAFDDVEELIEHAEVMFFESQFSHDTVERMYLGRDKKKYPEKRLEPIEDRKLKDLLHNVQN